MILNIIWKLFKKFEFFKLKSKMNKYILFYDKGYM